MALVREATRVVRHSKAMVVFPLVLGAAQLLLVLFCGLTLAYLHSSPAQPYATAVAAAEEDHAELLLAARALDQTQQVGFGRPIGGSAEETLAATTATWTAPVAADWW